MKFFDRKQELSDLDAAGAISPATEMTRSFRFKLVTGIWALFVLALAVFSFPHYIFNAPGYDFTLRVNEVEVVRQGIDPYDVFRLRFQAALTIRSTELT